MRSVIKKNAAYLSIGYKLNITVQIIRLPLLNACLDHIPLPFTSSRLSSKPDVKSLYRLGARLLSVDRSSTDAIFSERLTKDFGFLASL